MGEAFNADERVLTYCTGCDETIQTDGDQVPTDPATVDELCVNLCGEDEHAEHVPGPGHVHALRHEVVTA